MAGKSRLPVRDFEFIEIQPLNLDKESEKKPNSPEAPKFSEDSQESQEEMSEIHLEKEKGKKDVKKTQTKVSTPLKKPKENLKQKSPVKETPKKRAGRPSRKSIGTPICKYKNYFLIKIIKIFFNYIN
jgi:hypothetical protein